MLVPGLPDLSGLSIMVVEDMVLVADVLRDELSLAGCRVVGPVGRVSHALALVQEEQLDGALLDVNLAGEMIFPVADALLLRGVPFVFLSGYSTISFPPRYQQFRRLTKPVDVAALMQAALSFRR